MVMIASTLGWSPAALARPTDANGLFSFSITDEVTHWETPDGAIRVHYSVQGPNVVRAGDANDDGIPDFVEQVASIAQEALSTFGNLNFLPPLAETEFTLIENGGSDASGQTNKSGSFPTA